MSITLKTTKYKPLWYNTKIVTAFFADSGIPEPKFEYRFHPERKWRFDICWPMAGLALEVDGGIWIQGGHNRGAQMLKTWEKENEAICSGYRILRCQPKDVCTTETAKLIKRALGL
jgi:hypothetical protein